MLNVFPFPLLVVHCKVFSKCIVMLHSHVTQGTQSQSVIVISASRAQSLSSRHAISPNGRYCHPLSWAPDHDTQTTWLLSICAGCFREVHSRSTTPCTTVINAFPHILTSQSLFRSCHDRAPAQLAHTTSTRVPRLGLEPLHPTNMFQSHFKHTVHQP